MGVDNKPGDFMRFKIAHMLFSLSSVLKSLGKLIITKEKTIVIDALSLPGWFVLDNFIICQRVVNDDILRHGFEWLTWPMPNEWIAEMEKLKAKKRG